MAVVCPGAAEIFLQVLVNFRPHFPPLQRSAPKKIKQISKQKQKNQSITETRQYSVFLNLIYYSFLFYRWLLGRLSGLLGVELW